MSESREGARWEHFAHGADIGIRGRGADLAAAFEGAARALTAVITDPREVEPRDEVRIVLDAPDREILFYDWIHALVVEMATRGMLFSRFEVRVDGSHLEARALGEPVDRARHEPAVEVKGPTFTALRVAEGEGGEWYAQCVVDV